MPSASDLKVSENLVVLACGKPGCGKTSAIVSFATQDSPMYVFDIDHRIRGILGSTKWLGDSMKHIQYDQYDVRDGFKSIEEQLMLFSIKYDKRQLEFKNILFESVGSLSQMFLIDSQRAKGINPGMDLSKLSAEQKKGARIIGNIAFPVPNDYQYGMRAFHILFYNYFTYFSKCNIFLSGWTTDKWGKDKHPDGQENPYAPEVIIGRRLLATNNLASELPGYFDDVWEFNKEETGASSNPLKYTVQFRSDLAKTCIQELPNKMDITNKNFREEFNKAISKQKEKETNVTAQ